MPVNAGPPIKGAWAGHRKGDPKCDCTTCQSSKRAKASNVGRAGAGSAALALFTKNGEEVLEADAPRITSGRSSRDTVGLWLMIRASDPNLSQTEIAAKLGISRQALGKHISRAVKEGWLKFDEPLKRLEYELMPKVINNLNHFLDAKDKTVTLETAKGTLFKDYQVAKGSADTPTTVLAFKFDMPQPDDAKVVIGQIVGKPRELEE